MSLNPSGPYALAWRWSLLADEVRRRLGPGVPVEPTARAAFIQPTEYVWRPLVHRAPIGASLGRALQADALSIGQHVVGSAALDQDTRRGQALLAHELTHVALNSGASKLHVLRQATGAADEEEATAQQVEASALRGSTDAGSSGEAEIDL